MNLNPADSACRGVLFPVRKGESHLIAIPLVLHMGWAESPPTFCVATEIGTDLANATLTSDIKSLDIPHHLDVVSERTPQYTVTEIPIASPSPSLIIKITAMTQMIQP